MCGLTITSPPRNGVRTKPASGRGQRAELGQASPRGSGSARLRAPESRRTYRRCRFTLTRPIDASSQGCRWRLAEHRTVVDRETTRTVETVLPRDIGYAGHGDLSTP